MLALSIYNRFMHSSWLLNASLEHMHQLLQVIFDLLADLVNFWVVFLTT